MSRPARPVARNLAAALCVFTASSLFAAETTARAYRAFELKEGLFRCELPTIWKPLRDEAREKRFRVYGIYLSGPRGAGGAPVHLSLDYYAPDNLISKESAAYLKRQFNPRLATVPGEKTGPIEPAALGRLKGKKFVRDTFIFLPPESANPKQIAMREEHLVIDRPDGRGFYVFAYAAPRDFFKRYHPDFQHVLDTFRALDKK